MTAPRSPQRAGPVAVFLIVLSMVAIGFVRPSIAARFHRLRVTSDVYPFGSPEQVIVESLGYRAALADTIFAHVLVSNGLHFQEHRRFEFVGDYIDTVTKLDPTFRDPYRFADTLLVLSPEPPRLVDYERARQLMLRGIANRPFDTELWLTTGQYLAYLAPPYLPTEAMKSAWRLEGAKILARACELANDNANVPYNCIHAAGLLEEAGEREAAIESMRRLIAVSDDPEIQKIAFGYLAKRKDERERAMAERRRDQFRAAWKGDLPFVKKDFILVLGPRVDTARCAGPAGNGREGCATSWQGWRDQIEQNLQRD